MALQVWLPLNGNLNNQGLSDVAVTNNGATVNNDGKIGKCYEFDGNGHYLQFDKTFENLYAGDFSWALWVKPTDDTRSILISEYASTGASNVALELYTNRRLRIYWNAAVDYYPNYSLPKNVWTHVAVTRKGTLIKVYINGELIEEKTGSFGDRTSTSKIRIGDDYRGGTSVSYKGFLNDVRIYDHALSKREVKDIAKGLVLHYKLDDRDILMSKCKNVTYNQLIYDGNFNSLSNWRLNAGTNTLSVNNNIMTETFSGTATAWYHAGIVSNTQFTLYKNHKYFISFDVKSNKNIAIRGGYTKPTGYYTNITVQPNEWYHKIQIKEATSITSGDSEAASISIIIDDARQMSAGDWIKYRKVMFVDLTLMFGSGNEPTAEEADIIFDHYMPYNMGEVMDLSMPILDCSGYNNDGTIIGTLSLSDDSPRYQRSTVFTKGNNHIVSSEINKSGWKDSYSVCWWSKTNNMNNNMAWGSKYGGGGNYLNLYPSGGVFCWNTGDGTSNPVQNNGTSLSFTPYNDNKWHHYVMTGDGVDGKLYIDGEYKGKAKTYKPFNTSIIYLSGWANNNSYSWDGGLNDFRIYSTTLSDKDIQELYNLSAWVDKNGNLNCYEGIELESNPEVNKRGQFKSKKFDEVEFYDYLENVSTSYIDTEYDIGPDNGKNIKLYIDYIATNTQVGNRWWVHGLGGASNLTIHAGIGDGSSGTNVKFVYGNGTNDVRTSVYGDIGTRYIYELDLKNKTYIVKDTNGNTLVNLSNFTVNTPTKTYSPYIYAWKRGSNGVLGYSHSGKMYRYRLYDNDVLVRNFIPCKYAGEAGMWDIVEGKFYGNKGSGTFVLGDRIDVDASIYANKIESNQLIEI